MNEHFQFRDLKGTEPLLQIFTVERKEAAELDEKIKDMIYKRLDKDSFDIMVGLRKPTSNAVKRTLEPVVKMLTEKGIEIDAHIAFAIGAYYASAKLLIVDKQRDFEKHNGMLVALSRAAKPEKELTDEEIEERKGLNIFPMITGCSGDCDHCTEEDKKKFHEKMGAMGGGNGIAMEFIKTMVEGETPESPDWVKELLRQRKEEEGE